VPTIASPAKTAAVIRQFPNFLVMLISIFLVARFSKSPAIPKLASQLEL
jgi:hypothetical protein